MQLCRLERARVAAASAGTAKPHRWLHPQRRGDHHCDVRARYPSSRMRGAGFPMRSELCQIKVDGNFQSARPPTQLARFLGLHLPRGKIRRLTGVWRAPLVPNKGVPFGGRVRELNSQSATNQAAALPLSYPAEKRHFNRCEHAMRASRLPFQRFVDGSEDLPRKNCLLERVGIVDACRHRHQENPGCRHIDRARPSKQLRRAARGASTHVVTMSTDK
jgi:hypothetical protein